MRIFTIVVQGDTWKIFDLSLAYHFAEFASKLVAADEICTVLYRPPELLMVASGVKVKFGGEVDIWGLGVVWFEVCTPGRGFHMFPMQFFHSHSNSPRMSPLYAQWSGMMREHAPADKRAAFCGCACWRLQERLSSAELLVRLRTP